MASITIKGIPDELHRQLKERAARNRRSLNAEVIAGLETLFETERIDPLRELEEIRQLREKVGGYLTQELIEAYIEEGRRH